MHVEISSTFASTATEKQLFLRLNSCQQFRLVSNHSKLNHLTQKVRSHILTPIRVLFFLTHQKSHGSLSMFEKDSRPRQMLIGIRVLPSDTQDQFGGDLSLSMWILKIFLWPYLWHKRVAQISHVSSFQGTGHNARFSTERNPQRNVTGLKDKSKKPPEDTSRSPTEIQGRTCESVILWASVFLVCTLHWFLRSVWISSFNAMIRCAQRFHHLSSYFPLPFLSPGSSRGDPAP